MANQLRLQKKNYYSKITSISLLSRSYRKALICISIASTLLFTIFACLYNDSDYNVLNNNSKFNINLVTPSAISSQISQLNSKISNYRDAENINSKQHSNNNNNNNNNNEYPFEVYKTGNNDIKTIPYELILSTYDKFLEHTDQSEINWSEYAYVTYSTNIDYLKSAILNCKRLREITKTKADIVILYSTRASSDWGLNYENSMIAKAEKKYDIIVHRVKSLTFGNGDWNQGFTKFYAFSLITYTKLIYFDSDCLIYNNFDELFFGLPDAMIYAPPHYSFFRDVCKELKIESKNPIVTGEIRTNYVNSILNSSLNEDGTVNLDELYYKLPSIKKNLEILRLNDKSYQVSNYFF